MGKIDTHLRQLLNMADIKTLEDSESPSPSASASPSASPSPSLAPPEQQVSSSPVNTAVSKLTEGWKKLDKVALLISGVILGQLFIIYQLISSDIQITIDTYVEYKNTIKEFNNEKYDMLERRVQELEDENKELKKIQINTQINEKKTTQPEGQKFNYPTPQGGS